MAGAARRHQRKRQNFLPNNGPHSTFLTATFGRKSQLPNPLYMAAIDPTALKSTDEEVADAVRLKYANRGAAGKPEAIQTALYRILLAGLKPYYSLPSAQKSSRGPESWE